MKIITLPNCITLLRFPLAFVFLQEDPFWRLIALLLAMMSDVLDGFLARRYCSTSRFGTTLDPIADKFFALFVLSIFVLEDRLALWQALTMLGRDIALLVFGSYLFFKGTFGSFQFRAILCGKVTTSLQLIVMMALTLQIIVPSFVFILFIVLGILSLGELLLQKPVSS